MKWLCAVLISLALCSTTWASIGSIVEVTGAPGEIVRNKEKLAGSKGAPVDSNDIITTRAGVTDIKFRDDTKVKVNANSRLLIDEFVFDPKAGDAGKLAMKVGLGTVRYASGQIAKNNPQQVAIKTPTATIAVRGTDFSMIVDEAGRSLIVLLPSCPENAKNESQCVVGKISVGTLGGEVFLSRAYQATYVASATSRPTVPVLLQTSESEVGNEMVVSMPIEIGGAVLLGNNGRAKASYSAADRMNTKHPSDEDGPVSDAQYSATLRTLGTPHSMTRVGGADNTSSTPTAQDSEALAIAQQFITAARRSAQSSRTSTGNVDDVLLGNYVAAKNTNTVANSNTDDGSQSSGSTVFISLQRLMSALASVINTTGSSTTSPSATSSTLASTTQIIGSNTVLLSNTVNNTVNTIGYNAANTTFNPTINTTLNPTTSGLVGVNNGTISGSNTVSTTYGTSYTSDGNMLSITVNTPQELIASCDNISRICITVDGMKQYETSDGLLNNGSNPVMYGNSMTISRLSESTDHYTQMRLPMNNSSSTITLIQNDVTRQIAIGLSADANVVTINQRWSRR